MFNFHKGTSVIKTLCNWVHTWTWVTLILPDADITIANINSLRDLALDFIIIFFLLLLFLCREANISNMRAVRASTVIHVGQNTQGNALWNKISPAITDIRIRTGLVFSEDHWVCCKTVGNSLWNYYRGCVRKTQTRQIRTGLKSPSTSVKHRFL